MGLGDAAVFSARGAFCHRAHGATLHNDKPAADDGSSNASFAVAFRLGLGLAAKAMCSRGGTAAATAHIRCSGLITGAAPYATPTLRIGIRFASCTATVVS